MDPSLRRNPPSGTYDLVVLGAGVAGLISCIVGRQLGRKADLKRYECEWLCCPADGSEGISKERRFWFIQSEFLPGHKPHCCSPKGTTT